MNKQIGILVCCCIALLSQICRSEQSSDIISWDTHGNYPRACPGQIVCDFDEAVLVVGGLIEKNTLRSDGTLLFQKTEESVNVELSSARAYAASVVFDDSVIVIGGITVQGISNETFRLKYIEGQLKEEPLPKLPIPLAYAGAAKLGNKVYVCGGITRFDDPKASNKVFVLDVDSLGNNTNWLEIESIPSQGRIQPAVTNLNGELYIFGGRTFTFSNGNFVTVSLSDAWGYREVPLDGTTEIGWRQLESLPEALASSAVFNSGQAHTVIIGGFAGESSFESGTVKMPMEMSRSVYIYHNITDTWVKANSLNHKIAEAKVIDHNGDFFLIESCKLDFDSPASILKIGMNHLSKKLDILDIVVIAGYFIIIVIVGLYYARKQKNSEEFSLGSRKTKWWAAAISMFATASSSISFMAIPALAYQTNLVWFGPTIFLIFAFFIQALILFPLLRKLNLTSTFAFLEDRFGISLRLIASAQCICLQITGRMTVVMLLPSLAISAVTGIDIILCVLLMGALTTIYTSIGGFDAVIWTDVTQGLLMLGGAGLMVILAITGLPGGVSEFIQTGNDFNKFKMFILDWDYTLPTIWIFAFSNLLYTLGSVADQPVIQRLYATPLKDVRKLAGMFTVYGILIAILANLVGLAIFCYFRSHPHELDPTMTNDQVVPLFIIQRLPPGIAGLIIASLFAASMSTLSSSMNSVATITCEDFYRKIFKTTDKSRLLFMKATTLLTGVLGTSIAIYMAKLNISSMFQTWSELLALIGGGFAGIYILGMFTKRSNTPGVIIGAVFSIFCTIYVKRYTELHWTFYGFIATASCISVGYIFSLIIPAKQKNLTGLTIYDLNANK